VSNYFKSLISVEESIGLTNNNWYNVGKVSFVETSIYMGGIRMKLAVYDAKFSVFVERGAIYYEP
jgi:hypothetical protein